MGMRRQALWERLAEYLGRYGEHIAEYGWLDPISSTPMILPDGPVRPWTNDEDRLFRWWADGEEPTW